MKSSEPPKNFKKTAASLSYAKFCNFFFIFEICLMRQSLEKKRTKLNIGLRRYDMNGISQMQGGKNWIFPNGGSVAEAYTTKQ